MSKYTDSDPNFKLIHASSFSRLTDRNIMILYKFLNELGLQDHFHECFLAIHLATDWNRNRGYKALSLWLMAKKLAINNSERHVTVHGRLKKKWKSFLDRLDSLGLTLIEYNRITDPRKTVIEYSYRYEVLSGLFSLPLELLMDQIDREVKRVVEKELGTYLKHKPIQKIKSRSPESLAESAIKILVKLRESMNSDDEFWVELELAQERLGADLPTKQPM